MVSVVGFSVTGCGLFGLVIYVRGITRLVFVKNMASLRHERGVPFHAHTHSFRNKTGPVSHDWVEIIVIRGGSGCLQLTQADQVVPVRPGSVIALKPRTLYGVEPDGELILTVVFLSRTFVLNQIRLANPDTVFDDLSAQHVVDRLFAEPIHTAVMPPALAGQVNGRLDRLVGLTTSQSLLDDSLQAQHLATGVLEDVVPLLAGRPGVLREYGDATRCQAAPVARVTELGEAVRRAVALVERRFAKTWTLEVLADWVDMSRSGLEKAFNTKMGCSPMALRDEYRINEMGRLLAHCGVSVTEAAKRVGWACPKHAIEKFRDYTSKTPTQWLAARPVVFR